LLRDQLAKRGLRGYRKNYAPLEELRSKPDVVFTKQKIAIYVHGCFWHGCRDHQRNTKANVKWWADKIKANKQRDAASTAAPEAAGWRVVRVWEHEAPDEAADRIAELVLATATPDRRGSVGAV
jgi:DNA mismatch endonuclease, patch repair protein